MNIDSLKNKLSTMSAEDMNDILDNRDTNSSFESSWLKLYNDVGGNGTYPDAKNIFINISNVTHQHEITSYIADDIDLIYRADQKGIQTSFLQYLKDCYKKGVVPE